MKTSIIKSKTYNAHKCLVQFVHDVKHLYGEEQISFNVHALTHLTQSVLDWGPLWSRSAFIFEDFNQEIKSYVKISKEVEVKFVIISD